MRRTRSAILMLLLLASPGGGRGQTIRSRGYQRFGARDQRATGNEVETIKVGRVGECAARTVYRLATGFNFNRNPDSEGLHDCQPTNRYPSCHTNEHWEANTGWDYYYGGRAGQAEPATKSANYAITTYSADLSKPATLSLDDPNYRWPIDCNYPLDLTQRKCSRVILTGIYNDGSEFNDMDSIRCYQYGEEFRVSQEVGAVVDVVLRPDMTSPADHECPRHQVVTALMDQTSAWFSSVNKMKCNLLLGNWRVDYEQCTTREISGSGGGNSAQSEIWNVGTPGANTPGSIYAVVGMWRVGDVWTGWKTCRLYRMA